MDNQLFRQKSMDRISSPEQLQDYMRVTNPGIWMVLAAVIAILVGMIVFSVVGRLESRVAVQAVCNHGKVSVTLPAAQIETVKTGMPLRVGDQEAPITYIYENEQGETVASAEMNVPEGRHDAVIVTEVIAPISFLLDD